MGVVAILARDQVGANWPRHILLWPIAPLLALYGPIGHSWKPSSFMVSGHILPSLASLANILITNPQAFIFESGPGGSFCHLGASRPPSHHFWFWAIPFHQWSLGLNGLFGPFRPPTASAARGLRSVGQLGPFWPNPMRTKGGNHLAPKARWVPNINWTHLNQFGHKSRRTHFWPLNITPTMASGNHQRPPDHFRKLFPQLEQNSFIPPCTLYSRLQQWCIYGIIYHYAPFWLSNSMVTL
ncbi:hypothetical protein O181_130320 [Austropuccinia psidii MF-1]|uniref:Uncharacterized protein n=1 Tax=Austropuccinia psidii MF-1 TaxID=1389203 RepID=A0A9Q3L3I9_9BASI|nr:hypothetical protein [Austropuccinia psidii MF-1]